MNQTPDLSERFEVASAPLFGGAHMRLRAAGVVMLYVAGWLALDRATQAFETSPGITPWYPVPALSLVLLLIFGPRYTPALLIGPLLSAFWLHPLPFPLAPLYAGIVAALLALVYGAAAAGLRFWARIDLQLRQLRDVVWFVLLATIAAPLVAALSVVAGFAAAGMLDWANYPAGVVNFWIGDAIGILVLAPFLLVLVVPCARALLARTPGTTMRSRRAEKVGWLGRSAILEGVAQLAAIVLIPWLLLLFSISHDTPRLFVCFLPLLWVALRRGCPEQRRRSWRSTSKSRSQPTKTWTHSAAWSICRSLCL